MLLCYAITCYAFYYESSCTVQQFVPRDVPDVDILYIYVYIRYDSCPAAQLYTLRDVPGVIIRYENCPAV
jgi:hypothetical protein